MATTRTKTPPAKALINALRSIGYSFQTALADIIDNSISAEADRIQVIANPDVNEPYVAIFDNGHGMGRAELDNAMTLGSNRDLKEDSEIELGRFGLGLESASFSQCLRLTVASKNCNRINAMRYDLEKILGDGDLGWVVEDLSEEEVRALPEINLLQESETGTLVIWERFDKIQEEASDFRASFISTIATAKQHVELVFHRFYDDIVFEFNGKRIERRDPFLSTSPNKQEGRTETILIDGKAIVVTPFVLPYASSLTEDQKRLLGNPKSIYDDQGFYIYRNKRLIIWGSWLRMNIRSEFNKLARVRVDVPSTLDSIWMLDVKKSMVKIPDRIKEELRISVNDSVVRSKREIKYPGKKEAEAEKPLWHRIDLHNGVVRYELNKEDNGLYLQLVGMLDDDQRKALKAYLEQVEQFIPKGLIVSDNADSIKILNSEEELEEDALIRDLLEIAKHSPNPEFCIDVLLQDQGFKKIAYRKAEILEGLHDGV